jgi:hypothetical protein
MALFISALPLADSKLMYFWSCALHQARACAAV